MSGDGRDANVSDLGSKTITSQEEDAFSVKSHPLKEASVIGSSNGHIHEQVTSQPKKAAKIHDFCFGIPFGEFYGLRSNSFLYLKNSNILSALVFLYIGLFYIFDLNILF